MTDPPETPRHEVIESLHGEEVVDPYRWLEGDDEGVEAWVARQNEYADAHLAGETRERLRPRFERLAARTDHLTVVPRGDRTFRRVQGSDEEQPVLYAGDSSGDSRRVLVDPNDWPRGRSMDWYVPSPDGSLVACGVAEGGDEQYDLRVVRADDGEVVAEVPGVGRTDEDMFAWAADGFYYAATGGMGEGDQLRKKVRHREMATGEERVLANEFEPAVWPVLTTDPAGGTLVVARDELSAGTDVFVLDDGDLRPVVRGGDADYTAQCSRETLYLRTDHDAPNGRVLAHPLADLRDGPFEPAAFREVVPETDAPLGDVVLAGDRLLVHRQPAANSRLSVYGPDGERDRDLPVSDHCLADGLTGHPDRPEAYYRVQSFDRPPAVQRADLATGETAAIDDPGVPVDVDLTVEQRAFESADGTEVPLFVVHREGLELDGDNPALLMGYGGFRTSMTPGFFRYRLPFLADGGVVASACLRGGGEFGEEWHRAATRETKQRTFDDHQAAAEYLCEAGYTNPDRLAALGGSNGGLTVGATVTQRPDLFAAAIAVVPLMDMLRYTEFLIGETWTAEYGDPDDPDAFTSLREYSPYHNVAARDYPAMLLETAAGDSRVHPAHARKMAALLQAKSTSGKPMLLRSREETGHGLGKPRSMVVEENLDRWTFLYEQLGVEPSG